jgi:hypothetical protein
MATDTKRGVPGVPLGALDAIQDQNTKLVLRSIVDGWHVRNGTSGSGDQSFVTKAEVDALRGAVGGLRQSVSSILDSSGSEFARFKPGEISRIINDLQAQVIESQLFKELGERIDTIDLNLVAEQNARIAAVQGVANDLAAEAATRLGFDTAQGAQIATLQTTTATQATQITGLTTRIGTAESTIVNLQSTTATQATALSSLTTRVGSSESNITSLQQTTAAQASSLTALTTRVGTAESSISTLNTTTANQATSLTSLTTRVGSVETGLTGEATTRANADNAITESVATQFSTVNTSIAALQTKQTTTANSVAALTSTVSTLQSSVGANTLAISTEATARVNADNDIYGKYAVKIDNNGYVTGFGLISTSNNSTPSSEFLIRADRFAIASPSGPGISPKAPFIVTTTPRTRPDGVVVPPGVYMDTALVKDLYGAYIEAGYFRAGKIYTGSQYIDSNSNQPIPVVANGSYATSLYAPQNNPGYATPYTVTGTSEGDSGSFTYSYTDYFYNDTKLVGSISSNLIFYGPDAHWYCPYNQRIRSSVSSPLEFVVSVACMVDHSLSIWYRIWDLWSGTPGAWTYITMVTEPQASYGAAALIAVLTKYLGNGQGIEFTAAPVNAGYVMFDRNKINLYDLNVNVRVTNL